MKESSKLHSFYYGLHLDEFQSIELKRLYENSDTITKSQFILSAIPSKPVKVMKIDKIATDYHAKPTNLQNEYHRIGVNYSRIVRAVHSRGLAEKKAPALLYKLEQLTVELMPLNKEIIRLTEKFRQWLQRQHPVPPSTGRYITIRKKWREEKRKYWRETT